MSDDVERARQRLRSAENTKRFAESGLASGSTNSNEVRVADARYQAALLDLRDAEAAAAGTPPARSAPASNPTPTPPPSTPPPQVERTTSIPVGETRETVLGGYESEARAESTATRLIEREQSDARAQGREPAQYEVVETTDDGFVIQKVTDGEATPAQTGYVGGRGSVVEQQGERASAAVPATPQDTGYSDPFSEGGDVQDIVESQIQRSPNATTNEDYYSDPFSDGADVNDDIPESTILRDPENVVLTTAQDLGDGVARVFAPIDVDDTQTIDEFSTVVVNEDGTTSVGSVVDPRVENRLPTNVDPATDKQTPQPATVESTESEFTEAQRLANEAEQTALANQSQALLAQARNQATLSAQRKANGTAVGDGDWRVRLRLAPNATYLYKAQEPGILAPLLATDGVIFPYTPQIDIAYRSNYQPYSPTHSNYKHYFYQGSSVEFVTMTADFTAQDTLEAEYLLAVIHFMKSASKMFYGQDVERGSPPPLLYLTGLGEYQFNEAPCVIQEFNYNLPKDVDYIRARSRQISGADTLQYQRPLSTSTAPSYSLSAVWDRLRGANLPAGATPTVPAPPNLGLGSPTYVPTKLSMTITLLPVQSRSQVSQQFSLQEYANGNLIKDKGFW